MQSEIVPFIPISKLDQDLLARIKDTRLTTLREFRTALGELQRIQESRTFQGRSA